MVANWARLCKAEEFFPDPPHINVVLGDGRRHRVSVAEKDDEYLLSAIVVRKAAVDALPTLPVQAWVRNRSALLVGFRLEHRGLLIAESWVPKAGLTGHEFQLYVRTLAIAADQFEYALTGRDIE